MPLLNWINRNQAEETAGSVPYHLLHLEQSYGDKKQAQENLIIQGDNLQALKALIPLYAGQVKCIFIDPPYNTQSAFEHYDDKLEHAQWLSMMYPRLQILKDLLAEDGFMAIQIDDREFARLYLIMTEIFNEKYLKTISIKMSEPTGVKMASINKSKGIAKLKEFIILASKNGIKGLNLEKVPKDGWDYEYNTAILGLTKNELSIIKKILDDEERTEENIAIVENLSQKITFKSAKEVCISEGNKKLTEDWLFKNAWRIVQFATLTGGAKELAVNKKMTYENIPPAFVVTTKRLKAYLIRGEFNHQTKLPRCKLLFADKYLMVHLGDFWSDIKTTGLDNEGGVDFKNGKKPEKLLERIIKMTTNPNDLVLDSFLGSGTTSAVAHKMGRRYIGIEMGEHAKTHVIPRLQKVIDGEQGGISKAVKWQGGGGFSFYTLGASVFDEYGSLNPQVTFNDLANYVWWLETKTTLNEKPNFDNPYLGTYQGVAYYLLYNGILGDRRPNGGNVLTRPILKYLTECHQHNGKKVIIGEASRISDSKLADLDINFKHIPYDLYSN